MCYSSGQGLGLCIKSVFLFSKFIILSRLWVWINLLMNIMCTRILPWTETESKSLWIMIIVIVIWIMNNYFHFQTGMDEENNVVHCAICHRYHRVVWTAVLGSQCGKCLYNGRLVRRAFGDRLGMVEGQLACMLCSKLVAPRCVWTYTWAAVLWTTCHNLVLQLHNVSCQFCSGLHVNSGCHASICGPAWCATWLMKILGAVQYSPVSLMIGTLRIFLVTFLQL